MDDIAIMEMIFSELGVGDDHDDEWGCEYDEDDVIDETGSVGFTLDVDFDEYDDDYGWY